MTTTRNPGPRPADPSTIRFDRDCFEQVGERVEYTVAAMAPSYPRTFADKAQAEAWAARTGRSVTTHVVPVLARVRWS